MIALNDFLSHLLTILEKELRLQTELSKVAEVGRDELKTNKS